MVANKSTYQFPTTYRTFTKVLSTMQHKTNQSVCSQQTNPTFTFVKDKIFTLPQPGLWQIKDKSAMLRFYSCQWLPVHKRQALQVTQFFQCKNQSIWNAYCQHTWTQSTHTKSVQNRVCSVLWCIISSSHVLYITPQTVQLLNMNTKAALQRWLTVCLRVWEHGGKYTHGVL